MSRVGKEPIELPKDIKVKQDDNLCVVESPKNKMSLVIPEGIKLDIQADKIIVGRVNNEKRMRSLHGTIRMLISNMIKGVTEGFKKELEIVGVGYKAQIKGEALVLNIGFSHPIEMIPPEGVKVSAPSVTKIIVEGIDKQKVGEFAAKIRRNYPPEPYKGKGIRYSGEEVRRKLGKALAK